MCYFRESCYVYLLFKNDTITSTTSIHKGNSRTATIDAKKNLHYLGLLHPERKLSPVLKGLESSFWGSISNKLVQTTGVVATSVPHINS